MPTETPAARAGRPWLRLVLFALLVYAAVLAVRLADLPKWDNDLLRVDGEYIMGTHDAYAWLAGAHGVGTGAGTPLARMARTFEDLTGVSAGLFGFYAPAVFSSLVAPAVLLWAWTLGGLEAGLGAGFLAALVPGFYYRTRLGYYDTDIATLLFPVVQSWLVAHWLAPHLRSPWAVLRGRRAGDRAGKPGRPSPRPGKRPGPGLPAQGSPAVSPLGAPVFPVSLAWPLAAGVLVRLGGADWHAHLPDFNFLVAVAAGGLTLLLARPGARPVLLWGLTVFGLAGFFGPLGLAGAVGLALLFRYAPALAAPVQARLWPGLTVFVLLLCLTGMAQGVVRTALDKFKVYSKTTVEVAGQDAANRSGRPKAASGTARPASPVAAPPVYPGITQSVVEAQNMPLEETLARISPRAWITVAGLAGFLAVVLCRPAAVFLLPLAVLALLGHKLGVRMTMFGGPAVGLGLVLPVVWALRRLGRDRAWTGWAAAGTSAALGLLLTWPALAEYRQMGPTPILTRPHALALKELGRLAPPGSHVWTWWDWGYATQYYARRMTFADGARHSGEYLFPLALPLTTPIPLQSSQVIAFSALKGYAPWRDWNQRSGAEVADFIRFIGQNRFAERPKDRQYLVVAWENLRLVYWISYYGSWDLEKGEGSHGVAQEVSGKLSVDRDRGLLEMGGQPLPLKSVDVVDGKGRNFLEFHNPVGGHLVINDAATQALLLDDLAYNSAMVQLLLAAPDNPALKDTFRLVYEGFPMVRIYEVL